MLSHAVNAGLHDNILVKAEHLKAFLDDVTIASGSKSFILEFFLQAFDIHACNAFRTHEGVCMDDTGQFIYRKETFFNVSRRNDFIRA